MFPLLKLRFISGNRQDVPLEQDVRFNTWLETKMKAAKGKEADNVDGLCS